MFLVFFLRFDVLVVGSPGSSEDDKVPACCDEDSVGVFLLRSMIEYDIFICDYSVWWYAWNLVRGVGWIWWMCWYRLPLFFYSLALDCPIPCQTLLPMCISFRCDNFACYQMDDWSTEILDVWLLVYFFTWLRGKFLIVLGEGEGGYPCNVDYLEWECPESFMGDYPRGSKC